MRNQLLKLNFNLNIGEKAINLYIRLVFIELKKINI